ncbi:MAG TPA: outer membrane lipoprotein carrier protein LolA [Blastocatellia bacterium]|nr:outer membrane lipoprotein carrier protein LolA [Blastocatellia bacterium]
MKRFLSVAITLTLLIGLFTGINNDAKANTAPQLLTGILQKMENAHRNLKSMKAAIVQKRVNSQIGTSDTDYGVVAYKPENGRLKLRVDYTKPDTRTLAIVGDSLTFYQPRINQALKTSIGKATKNRATSSALLALFTGSAKSLTGRYNIDIVGEETVNGRPTTQLRLTPKGQDSVVSIELWVSSETGLPVQGKSVERNGDYTIVKLSNVELNTRIADADFNIKLPAGTAVVDKL